jgi:hypothetical protein
LKKQDNMFPFAIEAGAEGKKEEDESTAKREERVS